MKPGQPTRIPQPDQRWTVTIPKDKFDEIKGDPEFCALVTLGRAVNALHFVHTPLLSAENDDGPRAMRDRYNSLLFTCALFAEVMPLVEGMQRYFKGHPAFQRMADVTNGKEAHELQAELYRLRKTLVFHFDPAEVQQQMKTLELENPIFVTALGTQKVNTYLELSDLAALRTFFGPDFPKDVAKMRPVLQSISKLAVSFLEAAEDFMVALMMERGWADMQFL